jgi:RNA 3'-terminal phosphate cyclase (ATP)
MFYFWNRFFQAERSNHFIKLPSASMTNMIHIDGSHLEGGGQIIRTALALSTMTGRAFRADKIRHNRPKPGLKHQHLTCIEALKQLAGAQVKGDRLGSDFIEFIPGPILPGSYSLNIGTAGSITLLLQSLLLPCMFADHPVRLMITGGTDTKWSMPIDYFSRVILPFFNEFAAVRIEKMHRGFYPKGRGFVNLTIEPGFHLNDYTNFSEFIDRLRSRIAALDLMDKAEPVKIQGISCASQTLRDAKVAERQAAGAIKKIGGLCPVDIEKQYRQTASVGTVITLWALNKQGKTFAGADALGEKRKRAEAVGEIAAEKLLAIFRSDAAVDCHLADNVVPLMALAGGRLKADSITGHIRSNIYVCEKFVGLHFSIDEKKSEITVE